MKRRNVFHALGEFGSSVRVRLTLWYLAIMAFIMCLFGGSLYATQMFLNTRASDSRFETQVYQDAQRLSASYKQALLSGQSPLPSMNASSGEIILLLSSRQNRSRYTWSAAKQYRPAIADQGREQPADHSISLLCSLSITAGMGWTAIIEC